MADYAELRPHGSVSPGMPTRGPCGLQPRAVPRKRCEPPQLGANGSFSPCRIKHDEASLCMYEIGEAASNRSGSSGQSAMFSHTHAIVLLSSKMCTGQTKHGLLLSVDRDTNPAKFHPPCSATNRLTPFAVDSPYHTKKLYQHRRLTARPLRSSHLRESRDATKCRTDFHYRPEPQKMSVLCAAYQQCGPTICNSRCSTDTPTDR